MAGDESAPADFDVGQVAAAHFVVQQVAGQAGQARGFVDGVGQPLGWVWFRLADLRGSRDAGAGWGGLILMRRRGGARVARAHGPIASRPAGRAGTSRAVCVVRSLVIRSAVMVMGMGVRSWFGFQVWFWFACAAGFQELGEGWGLAGLPAAELVDHDRVRGTALRPAVVREWQVVRFGGFGHLLLPWPRVGDQGRGGRAAGSGWCSAGPGHWAASMPAAGSGWPGERLRLPGSG